MASVADHQPDPNRKGPPAEPRPSSSVLLLNPLNQVLLLQRVIKARDTFSGGFVFPGGNVEKKQDGIVPAPGKPGRHEDSKVYRLAACRETFEESGILLAKKDGKLLQISAEEREKARHKIHNNQLDFNSWVNSLGGTCDIDGLRPYTRWITPTSVPRRFTTQMYVYMLPLEESSPTEDFFIPRPDGGKEHNSATFKYAEEWIELAEKGDIILFPPQFYLLSLISPFIRKPATNVVIQSQRNRVVQFLETMPGDNIPWAKKVISPTTGPMAKDGRAILLLDDSGPELNHIKQGDITRFVLMAGKRPLRKLEIKGREELEKYLQVKDKL